MEKIILGSQSPRRKFLLEMAEIPFEIIIAEVSENINKNIAVHNVAEDIARQKLNALIPNYQQRTIITADTIVLLEGNIIGKPNSLPHAEEMLTKLSGKMHEVISGVCIYHEKKIYTFSEITEVYFRPLSASQIKFYTEKFQPLDKAGAYAIQEWIGAVGVEKINGCYYNVMGLPISSLIQKLEEMNLFS